MLFYPINLVIKNERAFSFLKPADVFCVFFFSHGWKRYANRVLFTRVCEIESRYFATRNTRGIERKEWIFAARRIKVSLLVLHERISVASDALLPPLVFQR